MPDEFDDWLKKALDEIEKRIQEEDKRIAERIASYQQRLTSEQEEAIERYLQSKRENTYFSLDPEDAQDYPPEASRGLFFSLEDALEYARDIPENIPVLIVQTEDGYEVVVMYE